MHPPPLLITDYLGPVVAAVLFVVIMSLVREPTRRNINAIIVAGASGAYLSGGGFGVWELLFPVVAVPIAYQGLCAYRFIALAWLMHSGWDALHHLWGNPIWPFMRTSSFGCMIFDALIAIWFLAGAPSIFARTRAEAPARADSRI
jgi:hypothetical protein